MTTTQKVSTAIATLFGAIALITTIPTTVNPGESKIVAESPTESVVITANSNEDKKVTKIKTHFDKETGVELEPIIETFNLQSLISDKKGKDDDLVRIKAELAEKKLLIGKKADTTKIVITKQFYDEATGVALVPQTTDKTVSEIKDEIAGLEIAIVEIQRQSDELQTLINEADKLIVQ